MDVLKPIFRITNQSCVFITSFLIGKTIWFSQSEVVLHSDASKYKVISGEKKPRKFLSIVGEYEQNKEKKKHNC